MTNDRQTTGTDESAGPQGTLGAGPGDPGPTTREQAFQAAAAAIDAALQENGAKAEQLQDKVDQLKDAEARLREWRRPVKGSFGEMVVNRIAEAHNGTAEFGVPCVVELPQGELLKLPAGPKAVAHAVRQLCEISYGEDWPNLAAEIRVRLISDMWSRWSSIHTKFAAEIAAHNAYVKANDDAHAAQEFERDQKQCNCFACRLRRRLEDEADVVGDANDDDDDDDDDLVADILASGELDDAVADAVRAAADAADGRVTRDVTLDSGRTARLFVAPMPPELAEALMRARQSRETTTDGAAAAQAAIDASMAQAAAEAAADAATTQKPADK